ncbi:2-methoxy-6-polyprenyl-1,4-benzoquinol methylase, mitochondrial [Porphyridium purpureum]|uniref:2-methoxy-6-polyprenyl-1,4-benzoquinol methylase, mitochondrial n=1 Tax=Porphyridium purpureum TaxID=35688 RepID=A0A5J4YKQ7_PORPP|nr:2-methoxy-6-polyprenyl-1,4-benzoquinol methylase, mitochondrial [Porphyridium purpureum]|eukprot:POR0217..scf244_11
MRGRSLLVERSRAARLWQSGARAARNVSQSAVSASLNTPDASVSSQDSDSEGEKEKGSTQTHFGFRTIRKELKSSLVGQVFSSVAPSYDVMNDLMSGGIHRVWKDLFVKNMCAQSKGLSVLDVAGGTGDIAFRIIEERRRAAVLRDMSSTSYTTPVMVCDINDEMLKVGRERANTRGYTSSEVSFFQGDAEKLPIESDSVDIYCISFGMRNVTDVQKALQEAFRVLRPGGRFMMLEFGKVDNPVVAQAYDLYSFNIIPKIGGIVASDEASYQYLVESIRRFPSQKVFADMMRNTGFEEVSFLNRTFGVVAEYSGFKPKPGENWTN